MNSSAGPSRGRNPATAACREPSSAATRRSLRQTVIALAKDAALAEHGSSGEATLIVLRGRVTLTAGTESWEGREGDLLILPDAPHSLTALADSAVLLTVAKRS